MRPEIALALKDLRLLARDKSGFFFTVFFPFLLAIFFGAIFSGQGGSGGGAGMPVAIYDADGTPESAAFIESLRESEALRIATAESFDEATERVRRGGATAAIRIPEGFSRSTQQMFSGSPAALRVVVDPARQAEAGLLQGVLMEKSFALLSDAFTDPAAMEESVDTALLSIEDDSNMDPEMRSILEEFLPLVKSFVADLDDAQADDAATDGFDGFQPVRVEIETAAPERDDGPPDAYAISFPQGAIWAVLGACAGFGVSLVTERTRGTLVRLRAAPLSFGQILLGKALACFLTTTTVVCLLFVVGALFFGVRPGSTPLLALAIVCVSVCFVGIMMLLSVVGRTETAAGGIGWAVLLVFAMLGGGMVPMFLMPGWMQTLGSVSPVKWAVLAMEGAIWRGYTPIEMLLPCSILLAIGIAAFTLGAAVFRAREAA